MCGTILILGLILARGIGAVMGRIMMMARARLRLLMGCRRLMRGLLMPGMPRRLTISVR
ncbi:hypothetical protein PA08_1613 [Cutibacterium modestum P08]|nr:hypothetical protein PA08_1613 [Cutibacterium modestum P08]